ncbi:integrin alpha-11 isoform X1 [Cygnus atratus]|uniref:integrin alpha-11 isoform X1 n=1 Tax=Cygnus atratus TaxID=8868 RepID=UPI0015D58B13|nr:integrin alpha-11 isoform X1 [Cygnus atratus]
MDLPSGLLLACSLCLLPGFSDTFNIDTKRPKIIAGSKDAYFGYTVQQHDIGGKKWLVVGAPYETNGQQKTGDVYKCPVTSDSPSNCTKLNLGRVTLSNVSERKDNMRLGLSLATNPKDSSFLACSPLWSHECGSSYYTTGMCSRVNANFRFAKTVAPALQRCQTYMDIIIVLDGSNSIYPWVEVQHFLINILKKFYIGPGQIQVGVVQYGEDVVHEFHLNDYRSVKDVVAAASHIEQRGGTETRTAYGIEFARSEAFQKGGRKGAKRVMIVITDGESHDSPDLEKVIEDSEKDNVTRYAVAVSSGALLLQEAVRGAHVGMWLPKEVLGRGRTLRGTQIASILTAPPVCSHRGVPGTKGKNRSGMLWDGFIHRVKTTDTAFLSQTQVLGYYNRRGINPEAFLNEIKFIASDPDDKHFFNVTDEAALKDIVDALGERIFSLEGTNKNEISFGLEMSQTGFSSHIVEDGILLGAVGAYDWNGAVLKETSSGKVIPLRESYLQEFPEELKNHGAYLGYTVSSVVSTARERLYVAGAPRFNHTGKVIIFTMHSNRNLTIHQALKGEQIGSYYGSEINSLDVNGDGVTDVLLVGAPMYFSEGRERGKVYVYALRENRFVSSGALGDLQSYQNSRFGSCIAAVPDLNQDSYNDVVVGAPLEDDHQGAIYIFLGFKETVLKKYKQRIAAADLGPGLMYFGCSIHGQLDMNEDGLVDLAVGSLGNAVLLWSRSVVQINASIRFEPSKINIFTKDCKRNGKDATCMSAFICFTAVFLSAHFQTASVALHYNATIDERRYTPRALLDESGERHAHQALVLLAGQEHCDRLHFHVLDTADYVKPVTFSVDYELEHPESGPMLDDGWPTSLKVSVPFWNGCNEDEHCVPDLVLDARSDVPSAMEYCRRALRRAAPACSTFSLSFDASVFVIESTRRRVAVEATLENRGENAYSTVLNISFSRNLQFASLIPKDDTDINIDCMSDEKHPNKRVCNVSYPFFRAKAKVAFRLDFEFSKSIFLQSMEIYLTANSDSEEKESTKEDNVAHLNFHLKYEADLLFTRASSLDYYEIKSNSSLERYDSIGPPFHCSFKLQNLGFFPVEGVTIKLTVPVATRAGNRLLLLTQFMVDQENATCNVWGNTTDYRSTPAEEDLSRTPLLNHSNSDVVSIDCNVKLAPNEEMNLHLRGNLWMKSLKALKFKSLKLTTNAALQRRFGSPFVFREEDPSRQVTFEISKPEESQIPIWIILGSTLGGLLLLALLVLALWKLGFFKSGSRRREAEEEQSAKVLE